MAFNVTTPETVVNEKLDALNVEFAALAQTVRDAIAPIVERIGALAAEKVTVGHFHSAQTLVTRASEMAQYTNSLESLAERAVTTAASDRDGSRYDY